MWESIRKSGSKITPRFLTVGFNKVEKQGGRTGLPAVEEEGTNKIASNLDELRCKKLLENQPFTSFRQSTADYLTLVV